MHIPKLKRTRTLAVAATSVAVATAGLAGCGGSSGSNGALGQVQKTHKLTIAMSAFAPEDFQTKSGAWSGYDPAILRGFAKSLGAKLVINSMPFGSSIEAVATHRDDITIDIYYTKKRAKRLGFSRPMLNYNDAVAVNSVHPQVSGTTLADLSGKKTAVVTGSSEVAEAKAIPHANVVNYDNIEDSLLALSSGKVADDLQPDVDITWAKHKDPSLKIKLLGTVPKSIAPPIAGLRGYYGLPKGSYGKALTKKLNAYLKKIACNGTEQKILDNYDMSSSIYLKGICKAPNSYQG